MLELLKLRFGEAALQACEVMLRDILDSRRVDTVICTDQKLNLGFNNQPATELHTRILSHLFWPSLHSETFSIPPEIESLQSRYATGFATLKQSRKLTWLHALGQVIVNLDLEDRTVTEEVQTWQASVVYAFHQESSSYSDLGTNNLPAPITRTVSELIQGLSMTESLVRNALTFWVGKLVLQEVSPDTYRVLETLSSPEVLRDGSGTTQATVAAAAAAEAVATAEAPGAVRSGEEVAQDKMEVFWQYVVGTLTNQGPMPLAKIVMVLKLLAGFPYGNEELRGFLEKRVQEGKLEVVGGNYKIVH